MIPAEIKKINEVADPQAGVKTPARKTNPEGENGEKAFVYRSGTNNRVKDAAEVPNAHKKAVKVQGGHGDALSDFEPHSNSGGSICSATDPGCKK